MELLAAIAAIFTFIDDLKGLPVIAWIDNQSVRAALASGTSKAEDIHALTSAVHWFCAEHHVGLWVEWVPSATNLADELSRVGSSRYSKQVEALRFPPWCREWSSFLEKPTAILNDALA